MQIAGWLLTAAALGLAFAALGFAAGQRRAAVRRLGGSDAERERESAYVRLLEYAAVAANEAETLEEAMEEGVKRICIAMEWPVGRIHTVEAEGTLQETRPFLLDAGRVAPAPRDSVLGTTAPEGDSLAERALATARAQWLADLSAARGPTQSGLAHQLDLQTAVAIPVLTHGRVAAVLEFFMRQRMEPDPRVLEVLGLVGVQIGRVAERNAVQQRLRQAQKLEAIGRLSAGVAHEINNPMAFVRSNLSQLASVWKRLRADLEGRSDAAELSSSFAECDELLEETIEGVERTVSIVRDMKEFSHVGGAARIPVDLRAIVDTALRVASAHLPVGVTLDRSDEEDLPQLFCRPNQLIQVLVNLVVNAIEASRPTGQVEVITCRENDHVIIQVEDTGPGMTPETRERVFDPFFTTKGVGEGTGLGLAISYEIVRSHGGEIRVVSASGAGTVMEVRLPIEGEEPSCV